MPHETQGDTRRDLVAKRAAADVQQHVQRRRHLGWMVRPAAGVPGGTGTVAVFGAATVIPNKPWLLRQFVGEIAAPVEGHLVEVDVTAYGRVDVFRGQRADSRFPVGDERHVAVEEQVAAQDARHGTVT